MPLIKKNYWKRVAFSNTSKKGLLPQFLLYFPSTECHIHLFSFLQIQLIVHSYQTMSIISADTRKNTSPSTLPTVTYWSSEFTINPSSMCHNIYSWLIFYFLKNFLVSQDIGLWSQWEVYSNPNSATNELYDLSNSLLFEPQFPFINGHNYTIGHCYKD